ncbi:MAG: hypothetical protein WD048_05120 [Chitinophagales bacterium]
MKAFAYLLSVFFHPMLLPSYALLLIALVYPHFLSNLTREEVVRLLATITTNTLIFPILVIFLMKKLNFINSYEMSDRKERIIPFIAISIFYFWTFMVVKSLGIGGFINDIMLGASLSVFAAFFFNLFIKISVHTLAFGNFITLLVALTFMSSYNLEWPLALVIVVAGMVGTSRLVLKAHNNAEVFMGYAIGFACQFIAFNIDLNFLN